MSKRISSKKEGWGNGESSENYSSHRQVLHLLTQGSAKATYNIQLVPIYRFQYGGRCVCDTVDFSDQRGQPWEGGVGEHNTADRSRDDIASTVSTQSDGKNRDCYLPVDYTEPDCCNPGCVQLG